MVCVSQSYHNIKRTKGCTFHIPYIRITKVCQSKLIVSKKECRCLASPGIGTLFRVKYLWYNTLLHRQGKTGIVNQVSLTSITGSIILVRLNALGAPHIQIGRFQDINDNKPSPNTLTQKANPKTQKNWTIIPAP